MRVTFICPDTPSGGTRVVASYADRLARRGHDVFVVSPRRVPTLYARARHLLKGNGWLPSLKNRPSFLRGLDITHSFVEHKPPISEQEVPDADVIVATWWRTAEWIAEFSERKGKKIFLVQDHEVFGHESPSRVESVYHLPLRKIVVSQWLAGIMRDTYGDNDVTLIPNAVDVSQFDAPPRSKQACLTVGFLYRTASRKNTRLAIDAIQHARSRNTQVRVIAFGATAPDDMELRNNVEFFEQPSQSKIPEIYATCDAWLFTSREEGFGLPILEAMACRTPVLASAAGAAPELVSPKNGYLLPLTPAAFADAIIEIDQLSNSQWKRMSDNAYETARRYSWDDAVDLFERTLQDTMDSSRNS